MQHKRDNIAMRERSVSCQFALITVADAREAYLLTLSGCEIRYFHRIGGMGQILRELPLLPSSPVPGTTPSISLRGYPICIAARS